MKNIFKGLGSKFGKLASQVKQVAPLLAAGLQFAPGGPVVNAAVRAIASVVGGDPDNIGSLEAGMDRITSDDIVKLRVEEKKYAVAMKRAEVDLTKAYIGDVQDARRVNKASFVPAVLSFLIVGSFVTCFLLPMFHSVPSEIIQSAIVGLGPLAGSAVSYWMGSSRTMDNAAEKA